MSPSRYAERSSTRVPGKSAPDCSEDVEPVDLSHPQVDDDDLWPEPIDAIEGVAAALGFADEIRYCLGLEGPDQAVAIDGVVVDDQDARAAVGRPLAIQRHPPPFKLIQPLTIRSGPRRRRRTVDGAE